MPFSIEERDLLPVSNWSGANFNVYLQYSRIEERVEGLLHSVYKQIIDAMLITQM